MSDFKARIQELADVYANQLKSKVDERMLEMENDDISHHLIYRVLGVSDDEGHRIDHYQNKGRFLYKYAGSFLEEAAFLCFKHRDGNAKKLKIPNTLGAKPKTFEIDCLSGNDAHEIKWRDATTDGDHITKEHTRIKVVSAAGYTPVRVMFYYPNRAQAQRIQQTLETLYRGVGGQYYCGNNAWSYIRDYTGIDLLSILEEIANERESQ